MMQPCPIYLHAISLIGGRLCLPKVAMRAVRRGLGAGCECTSRH